MFQPFCIIVRITKCLEFQKTAVLYYGGLTTSRIVITIAMFYNMYNTVPTRLAAFDHNKIKQYLKKKYIIKKGLITNTNRQLVLVFVLACIIFIE